MEVSSQVKKKKFYHLPKTRGKPAFGQFCPEQTLFWDRKMEMTAEHCGAWNPSDQMCV